MKLQKIMKFFSLLVAFLFLRLNGSASKEEASKAQNLTGQQKPNATEAVITTQKEEPKTEEKKTEQAPVKVEKTIIETKEQTKNDLKDTASVETKKTETIQKESEIKSVIPDEKNKPVQEPIAQVTTQKETVKEESKEIAVPEAPKEEKPKDTEEKPKEEKEPKKKPKKEIPPAKEEILISSLDTLDVEEGGNWLLKRVWWEQAELTFEKVMDINDQIVQTQTVFFNKNKEIDKSLSDAFRKLGYEQGELDQMLTFLIDQMNKERASAGDLSLDEREYLDLLNQKKTELEKLKCDLEALSVLDVSIENAITQLIEQIGVSRDYEKKGWADFKEIGRVLNDKKAKVLFYQVDADLKNVQNILNYIKSDLTTYFDNLIVKAESLSAKINTQVEALTKDGVDIKNKFEELKEIQRKAQIDKLKQKNESEQTSKKEVKKSWIATVGDYMLAPIDWVKSFFK